MKLQSEVLFHILQQLNTLMSVLKLLLKRDVTVDWAIRLITIIRHLEVTKVWCKMRSVFASE